MKRSPSRSMRGGIWLRLVLFLAVLSACLAMAWMILLPFVAAKWVRERTGFDVAIRALYVNPFTARVEMRGLVITNPPAFPQPGFVDIREFQVDARLFSLVSRQWVVDEAIVDLAEIAIVKNEHGVINASLFQERLRGSTASGQATTQKEKPPRDFLIRHLKLRFDRLVTADYSLRRPERREFNLNFDRSYENVTSMRQLAAPLAEALAPAAAVITGILPEAGLAVGVGDKLKESARKAGETMKGFFDALEKTLKR